MPPWNNNQKRNKSWHSDGIISTLSLVLHTICDNINFARIITGNFFFWCLPARDIRFVGANVVCVRREREWDRQTIVRIYYRYTIYWFTVSLFIVRAQGEKSANVYIQGNYVCVSIATLSSCVYYIHTYKYGDEIYYIDDMCKWLGVLSVCV
jgi:hypothetical protein